MNITIGKFPGTSIRPLVLPDRPEGVKVRDALAASGIDNTGFDIRVNGGVATVDTVLSEGNAVLLTQKIKSNKGNKKVKRQPTMKDVFKALRSFVKAAY